MQMWDGAVWGGYPRAARCVTGASAAPSPPYHVQPTPERALVTPVAEQPQKKPHNTMDWVSWLQAELGSLCNHWQILALLEFVFTQTSSSVPRGGIWNGHFIYSSSGTLQSRVTLFLCMDMVRSPSASISPIWVLLCWCTQSEHGASQENQHPLLQPYLQHPSTNLLFSLFCRGVYTGETLFPAATRGYVDIPTFGQDFSEHQPPTLPHSRWNELPSIHHSYCLLSWDGTQKIHFYFHSLT